MMSDVEALYRATEGKIGTDEAVMINILASRSAEHLAQLNATYVAKSKGAKSTFSAVIKSETSGNFQLACLALMEVPFKYFARQINAACKGVGTDEKTLTRSLLLADAYEVQQIVNEMRAVHHRDLIPLLKKETSGNYERALVTYIETQLKP